ncbi:MAG: cupin domain-containing protein [Armatimonadetes bacterium]|nr:cupin domain-containing protein [Armatimonadota bacterium]
MPELARKNIDSPEETRLFSRGKIDVIRVDGVTVGRATLEAGWKWSESVKPMAGTDSCQVAHLGYMVSGRMRVVMDSGSEEEFGPGDVVAIHPGHDAWVVGNEPVVFLDFAGAEQYARSHARP